MNTREPARGGKSAVTLGSKAIEIILKHSKPTKRDAILEPLMLTAGDLVTGTLGGIDAHAPTEYMKKLHDSPFYDPNKGEYEMLKEKLRRSTEFMNGHKLEKETRYGRDVE